MCAGRSTSWGVFKDLASGLPVQRRLMSMVLSSPDAAQEGILIQQILLKIWKLIGTICTMICTICKIICTII
jgi:hypothetical protein